jgi:ribonuclease P protein component
MAWAPLHKSDIEALLGTRPVARTEHFVLHLRSSPAVASELSTVGAPDRDGSVDISPSKQLQGLAALVPKRHAKRAVTRNLIRRQVREVVRADAAMPVGCQLLVRLRAPFDRRRFPAAASPDLRVAVRSELKALLAQRPAAS